MPSAKNIEVGDLVAGKYRLLDIIGEGGMGVVYLAEHSLIEKRVALKILRSEYSSKPEVVSRFQQEAISASRIKHPNVLDVFDFGKLEDGSFFLAMEYLQGRDLAGELSESTTIVPDRAVRIALQMTRALAAAHARGVVHRDLKPENVFLHQTEEGDEIVKIVDFGIAQLKGKDEVEAGTERRRRLTRTGMIFGTPEYMSPEQAAGLIVDLRADIYATGVMLYEMFTGAVPFTGSSFMAVLSAHLTQPIPPMRDYYPELDISPELEAAVMRALEKNPDARFQSMRELANALQLAREGRLANPLGGLLPVPEVTINSFRPARGPGPATSPQFGKADPLPFDLVSREAVSERSNPRPSEPLRSGSVTMIGGTNDPSMWRDAETQSDSLNRLDLPEAKRSRGWLLAIVLFALMLGAAGSFAFRQYKSRLEAAARVLAAKPIPSLVPDSARVGNAVSALNSSASGLSSAATADDGAAPQASSVATKPVVLTIQTNLPGATVSKDGFQVCDTTPCSFEVERGAATELVAIKGSARGLAKVLAQKDQTVTINLVYPKANGKPKEGARPGLCEVTVDGLKILRPCQ
jgi:serine/threonine-protein kinase